MSPRIKKGQPMKYRGFYCHDELWQRMQEVAIKCDVSDSEFIRIAIEFKLSYIRELDNLSDSTKKSYENPPQNKDGTFPVVQLKYSTKPSSTGGDGKANVSMCEPLAKGGK